MVPRSDIRAIRNVGATKERPYRYASLNSTDRKQFELEMHDLSEFLGAQRMGHMLPTLGLILGETRANDSSIYPGRHLPIAHIEVQNVWRYQCLRIMDQILYTAAGALSDKEMIAQVKAVAQHDHHIDPKPLGVSTLKNLYPALSDLILATTTGGMREKYGKTVYRRGVRGHVYADPRPMAFAVDITLGEIALIEREVQKLIVTSFSGNREHFQQRYPLLAAMGYLREIVLDKNSDLTCKLRYDAPLATINYRPGAHAAVRRHIEAMMQKGVTHFTAHTSQGSIVIMPREFRAHNGRWALIAAVPATGSLQVFDPDDIDIDGPHSEATDIADTLPADAEDHIIGLSPLWSDQLVTVTLSLTRPNSWQSEKQTTSGVTNFVNTRLGSLGTPDKYGCVTFQVYLNDDFFEELMRMDRNCHIDRIEPPAVFLQHKKFWEERLGIKYVALASRGEHAKYVRDTRHKD